MFEVRPWHRPCHFGSQELIIGVFFGYQTNTASCGGFAGVSNSFGAALWALDYAMTMAYSNFTGALFHAGGQNAYYNPVRVFLVSLQYFNERLF